MRTFAASRSREPGARRLDVPHAPASSRRTCRRRRADHGSRRPHRPAPRRNPSSRGSLLHPQRARDHRRGVRSRCCTSWRRWRRSIRISSPPDSPTQRVGGRPIEGFATAEHLAADAQSRQRLQRGGAARVRRAGATGIGLTGETPVDYVAELKIDGLEHRADLRGRRPDPRRDPRRRRPRRGRDGQRARHSRAAAARCDGGPAGHGRSARRDLPAARARSNASTASARTRRSRRSPTRATPPPARCGSSIRRWSSGAG